MMFVKALLSVVLLQLINNYFSVSILSFIGFYAFLWWTVENCESIVHIVISLLQKYIFSKNYETSLKEKFGEWAGEYHTIAYYDETER